jgi:hypothetical protein
MNPITVTLWACVAVFVSTAVITLLALIGVIHLGGTDAKNHDFYLRKLFYALVLEVVASGVLVFFNATKTPDLAVLPDKYVKLEAEINNIQRSLTQIDQRLSTLPTAAPQSVGSHWELLRTGSDCAGNDIAATAGANPDAGRCNAGASNSTAVCWDGQLFRNGLTAWCTYKAIQPQACTGGGAPGRVFRCVVS